MFCVALATLSPGRAAPDRVQVPPTGPLVERYIKSRAEFETLFKRLETRFGPVAQEEGEDELLGIALLS
jgi:hypothetical protein